MNFRETYEYFDGDTLCEALVVSSGADALPCVLLIHDWSGRLDHVDQQADALAKLGYTVMAIDVYGKGQRGTVEADNSHLMEPFMADRRLLARRLLAAVDAACRHPLVDPNRIVAVGHCFGGLCALDLARSGDARIIGAVSIHGLFTPLAVSIGRINASVLVLHGWEDPFAPPDMVAALAAELTKAGADWQIHAYGHALHAFTSVGMNAPENGTAYNQPADRRSKRALVTFLAELFGSEAI
jgi:dienelactone hydrolase